MLKEKTKHADVGVICARFQVHDLTKGQRELIDTVKARHDKVIIFLGLSPIRGESENPLDFRSRKVMISEAYPDIDVYYIDDVPDDAAWSKGLDYQISKWKTPNQTVVLYGSRDCFLKGYKGKFPTCELESATLISGTEVRRQVCNAYPPTKDYRAGVISATLGRHPISYQAVDVAIIDYDRKTVLLIRKANEPKLRFTGGFTSGISDSLEDDARRETFEETGLSVEDIKYVGSCKVKDWRFEGKRDCIKTVLFAATYVYGKPDVRNESDVDEKIAEYHWVKFEALNLSIFMDEHIRLYEMLKKYLGMTVEKECKMEDAPSIGCDCKMCEAARAAKQ